jgi:D-ribulokinase
VLSFVGGRISPEMETPKLLWLKRNVPKSFSTADYFFDLPDYLTWRASGSLDRSICTVTCKWTYLAHEKRWDANYFRDVGLGELADEGFARIGTSIVEPGAALGQGLTKKAAADLGLIPGLAVGASIIDAHAGGIGTLGGPVENMELTIENRLAYIFGTSACSMASTTEPVFVNGVWGPYFSAMLPGLWLNEGGQSAAGAAIDHLVEMHPAAAEAKALAKADGVSLVAWLDKQVQKNNMNLSDSIELAKGIHVVPEFLGNRSPFAEPDARAIIAGLGLETDMDNLISLYIAGLSGIGYGLKQLLNRFESQGIAIKLIVASGGAAQSSLVCQMLADTTRTPVSLSKTTEPVLLGSAMLAAVASHQYETLSGAMQEMSGASLVFEPGDDHNRTIHQRRFRAFEVLQSAGRNVREMIQ